MMHTRHLIDTAVFDIGFSDEETVFQTQSELEAFIKRQMMGVVDEVFDAASEAGFVMRIPSLEVDLGSVPYHDYREELPRRLRERLKALLAEFRVTAMGGSASNSSVIDTRLGEYEQLEYFLLTGHLPWYSSLIDEVDLEGLLVLALRDNATRLKYLLQTTPQRHQLVARLVSQFSPAGITQLFHLLAPTHAPLVCELMEKLTLAWQGNSRIVNALGLSHQDALAQLWLFLIEIVLGQDGHQHSAQQLLAQALRAMLFEKYGINRKVVEAFVAQTDREDSAYLAGINAVMHQLIQERAVQEQRPDGKIAGEHERWQTLDGNDRDNTGLHDMEALQAMLLAAIESGDATDIGAVWDQLLTQHGSMLEQLLNKKPCLGSMLRQMAVSGNMNFQDLLNDLLENPDTDVGTKPLGRPMRQLLVELRQEQGIVYDEAKTSNNQGLGRAYTLYEQLNQALLDGHAVVEGGQAGLVKAIDELRHDYPWQLLRILRELQSGAIGWSSTPVGHATALLRQLVLSLLELTSQAGPGRESGLLDAVIANAAEAINQNHYYHDLLNCLIKGELIDFAAILAETQATDRAPAASAEKKAADELDSLVHPSALPGFTDGQVEEKLRQFLRGDIELSPAEAASLINGIIRLLERQPQWFLHSFVLADVDARQIARLIGLLPEHLLVGIVAELAGQPSQRMQKHAELITMACQHKQIGVTPALLRQIKWEFIFAYLAGSGRLFNEQGFIRQYMETLIELTRQEDPQQFRALLCQQLVGNMLPSTREASLRILDVLSKPVDEETDQQTDTTALTDEAAPAQAQAHAQEQNPLEEVYIANAGIVLATPYLPRLFDMLGLTEKSAFKDREARLRAVHMLQYLVNERSASPEYQLFLNKLLCGVENAEPIPREIELNEHEKEALNGLLQGMIDNWKVLGNTSVAGLRETFLQRQGRLQLRDDAWHLRVEPKAFDMLLDQLPWGFSTIKYPWMERVIYVEWR
jgi:hypothetical protein